MDQKNPLHGGERCIQTRVVVTGHSSLLAVDPGRHCVVHTPTSSITAAQAAVGRGPAALMMASAVGGKENFGGSPFVLGGLGMLALRIGHRDTQMPFLCRRTSVVSVEVSALTHNILVSQLYCQQLERPSVARRLMPGFNPNNAISGLLKYCVP